MTHGRALLGAALGLLGCDGVSLVRGAPGDARVLDGASLDDAVFVWDLPPRVDAADVPGDVRSLRCARDPDCPGQVCDPASGRCVDCLPTNDRCPADQHCDGATRTCAPGCHNDDGCRPVTVDGGASGPPLRCHVVRHACVACVSDAHCPAGSLCVGDVCVPGCNDLRPCPAPSTCCAGSCVETARDVAHCGGCDRPCAAGRVCRAGACEAAP